MAAGAALWLLGLYAAAPVLRGREPYGSADRLRDALMLGVAIPLGLGLVHLLYPAACWIALTLCAAIAFRKGAMFARAVSTDNPPYLLVATLAAVAWPQLMRPLLDGDSLSYHLPNAAAWTHAHSLWSTATRYWWYPPASELFASGLYATGGPFAMPWCGFGALALLGLRIVRWTREVFQVSPLLADALAAATVSSYPLAIQGGTMQNDVWLAAFWIESLWTLRGTASLASLRTIAVTALIKPQGWIFALIALIVNRAQPRLWFAVTAVFALWLVHDAVLLHAASISPAAGSAFTDPLGSTIVAHGMAALWLLVQVTLRISPFALLALGTALFAPLFPRVDRRLAWAGFAAAVVFFVLPFGYATNVAQLAGGASLRFAAPAVAAGALVLAGPARRLNLPAAGMLALSTLYGIWYVLDVFWNDGGTHVAFAVALLALAVVMLSQRTRLWWPNALAFGLSVVVAAHLAARHPVDYYNDALSVGKTQPGIYRWIAQNHPARVGGDGLRLGVVNVLSPSTVTEDLLDASACAQARANGDILVAVQQNDLPSDQNLDRMLAARECGSVLYSDPIAIATWPLASPSPAAPRSTAP